MFEGRLGAARERSDVSLGVAAAIEHDFVAYALAKLDQHSAAGPVQGIEPEQRTDDLHDQCGEVVAAIDMGELVRKDRLELRRLELIGRGKNDDRIDDADHS